MFSSILRSIKGIPLVATVSLKGVIQDSASKGVSLQRIDKSLIKAFNQNAKHLKAVTVVLNSPGGSPVQSSLIYKRIKQLKQETNDKRKALKPALPPISVIAVVEDVCASGGYYIAMSCDEILVDPSSIVGSIGVIGGGFGFVDMVQKIGVERRIYTSGSSKSQLDPFLPVKESDLAVQKHLMDNIHREFISVVKESRGARLKMSAAKEMAVAVGRDGDGVFDGSYYTGQDAIDIGLADSLGDLKSEVIKRYGDKCEIVDCSPKASPLAALFGMSTLNAEALVDAVVARLDHESLHARFGGWHARQ